MYMMNKCSSFKSSLQCLNCWLASGKLFLALLYNDAFSYCSIDVELLATPKQINTHRKILLIERNDGLFNLGRNVSEPKKYKL